MQARSFFGSCALKYCYSQSVFPAVFSFVSSHQCFDTVGLMIVRAFSLENPFPFISRSFLGGLFCSVLYPSSIWGLATTWTYFLHLFLSSVILTDSSTESPVYVLMLSIQVVHAWSSSPSCTWHCSLHYLFLQATSLFPHGMTYASFLALTVSNCSLCTPALLRTHSFIFFAVHKTHGIFLSPFISKAPWRVSSFFLRVQLSQPYVATGHTSTFISRIFVEIGKLWLFHIFCSDAPIACPLFNLVWNFVAHSPSSVIIDPLQNTKHLLQLFILNEYA